MTYLYVKKVRVASEGKKAGIWVLEQVWWALPGMRSMK